MLRVFLHFIRKEGETSGTFNGIHYAIVISKIFDWTQEYVIPGTTKLVKGASSGMAALGSTKAPEDSSSLSGAYGEEGFVANTTLAK